MTEAINKDLSEVLTVFPTIAAECFETLFGAEAEPSDDWEVVDRLTCNFNLLITMGCANDHFSSLILLSMNQATLEMILDEEAVDLEYASSALGEWVNTYCALLADNSDFSKRFGKQEQAVPLLYAGGCPFMPFLTGVQGHLKIGDHTVYVGFTVKKNNK